MDLGSSSNVVTGFYRVAPSFAGFQLVSSSWASFDLVLLHFKLAWVLPSCT